MRRFLIALLCAISTFAQAEVIDIDNAQFDALRKAGVPVVDIRLQSEWEETGIVPGSRLLTFFDAQGRANAPLWLERVKPIAGPNDPVIVICRSGNRTRAVSQFLSQQAGYSKVYNVRSGIKGWMAAGGQTMAATTDIAACKAAKTC